MDDQYALLKQLEDYRINALTCVESLATRLRQATEIAGTEAMSEEMDRRTLAVWQAKIDLAETRIRLLKFQQGDKA